MRLRCVGYVWLGFGCASKYEVLCNVIIGIIRFGFFGLGR
jgi:hypothetical protein